ncbi:NAD(P)-dependent oxidoreductase [Actinophytocola oryzae]|uniref:Putative NADH-flavin reductase n=1 Tax=Actinophytocola oryzae TaxID=502181 RepID=A0A4R7VRD4_9PSEU|nr:NAD(P)H-binding protein [Actinophytocola oryzae]TDV52353.1 putative NADH-flavin reductase [Actinophytocola oryzae]
MKLAVFGATGGVGTQLVKLGLAQGHTVTAIVRNPAKFTLTDDPQLQLVTVPDLGDTKRVRAAIAGCDAALSGVGPSGTKDVTAASVPTRHILAALEAEGINRFVAVSAAPVGPLPEGDGFLNRRIVFPFTRKVFGEMYGDLAVMEREIAASGLDWTVVRPPKLTNKPVGDYRVEIGGNVPRGIFASRAEVAHAMLALLTDERAVRQAVGVAR